MRINIPIKYTRGCKNCGNNNFLLAEEKKGSKMVCNHCGVGDIFGE